ncbi:hypothetical protein [Tenacibaculum jejuense]|uniref:Uncharacterized protein n=1 Tax=Tenacibaculum jejuense TaxID=584609 RepID=A0A238UEY4_9FLAO|nr:hypothetical protein [Tenacibaculum jejuense]SNR17721.1 protein of unknown function [Tenacibaculum jejuense]
MKKTKEELKTYFETGDKPTQEQYADLIDSFIDAKQPVGEPNRRFIIDENGDVSLSSETAQTSNFSELEIKKLKTLTKRFGRLDFNHFKDRDALPTFLWENGSLLVFFTNYNDGTNNGNYLLVKQTGISENVNLLYLRNKEKLQILFYDDTLFNLSLIMQRTNEIVLNDYIVFKLENTYSAAYDLFVPDSEGSFYKNILVIPIEPSTEKSDVIPIASKDSNGLMKANFYEEGVYSPNLGTGYTFANSNCNYVRIGNKVTVNIDVNNINGNSGPIAISAPFPINSYSAGQLYQLRGSDLSEIAIAKSCIHASLLDNFNLGQIDVNSVQENVSFTNGRIIATITYMTNVYTP